MPIDPETLAELATAPKRTTTDEGTVEERSADELIALDRHLSQATDDAALVPWGMKIAVTKPKGTIQ